MQLFFCVQKNYANTIPQSSWVCAGLKIHWFLNELIHHLLWSIDNEACIYLFIKAWSVLSYLALSCSACTWPLIMPDNISLLTLITLAAFTCFASSTTNLVNRRHADHSPEHAGAPTVDRPKVRKSQC